MAVSAGEVGKPIGGVPSAPGASGAASGLEVLLESRLVSEGFGCWFLLGSGLCF